MADAKPKTADKKPKRRLRAAPTLREQTDGQAAKSEQPTRKQRVGKSKIFVPLRAVGRLIKRLALAIARSPIGRAVKAIAMSRVMKPVRWLFRLLGRFLFLSYFRDAFKELKLVIWPDTRTTWRLTLAVILFAIVFGLFVAGLDWLFERVFRELILDL